MSEIEEGILELCSGLDSLNDVPFGTESHNALQEIPDIIDIVLLSKELQGNGTQRQEIGIDIHLIEAEADTDIVSDILSHDAQEGRFEILALL